MGFDSDSNHHAQLLAKIQSDAAGAPVCAKLQSGFLALSRLALSGVWVGDQQQAIFGFRGTDPALMDAAFAVLIDRAGDQA